MAVNNESIGVSAEVAICRSFNLRINPLYEARAEEDVVEFLVNHNVGTIFDRENIPYPVSHIAEGQNPIDFLLKTGQTLSVKTNQNNIGRAAPQVIGQPTQHTYFSYIESKNILPGFNICEYLKQNGMLDTYENRGQIFKRLSIEHISTLINMYWENMFDCDYLILFFNLEAHLNPLNNYIILGKMGRYPDWDESKFTFTQTLDSWKESNTLKYNGVGLGNFQVHRNRDCFKFRFDMKGVMRLLNSGLIKI